MWCSHSNKIPPLWLDCVISFDWLQTLPPPPFKIKRTSLLNPPEFTDLYHCCTCLCFNTSYAALRGCGFTSWHASCSEGRAMSKSTCRAQKGRGSAPGPRSHAESMATGVAGKHGLSPLKRPSKEPHLTDHPPNTPHPHPHPKHCSRQSLPFIRCINGPRAWICRAVRRKQSCAVSLPALEWKLRRFCYLKRLRNENVLSVECEVAWVGKKTEEVCEVRMRREWPYLAGSTFQVGSENRHSWSLNAARADCSRVPNAE